ncbi:hypothetical protein ACS127_00015 [Amphibacillus sp. Q70]|uniref:hypothetical protein n=1 Tax=Amphibacillus sp. Q70 TaxID=3453416 RepID=UPI003F829DB7
MKRSLFCQAVTLGACVSGVVCLLSTKGRQSVKNKATEIKRLTNNVVKRPYTTSLLMESKLETATVFAFQRLDLIHDLASQAEKLLDQLDRQKINK